MKTISIEGFDRVEPSTGFALAVFGPDGSGKTRLIAQAQAEAELEGKEVGVIVLDRKTRDTLKRECDLLGVEMPLTNKRDYVSAQDAMRLVSLPDSTQAEAAAAVTEVKKFYSEVVKRIFEDAVKLASHKQIMTIAVDPFTEFYDYLFYAHFGRKTQIPALSRTAVNQDAIDFIKAIAHKHVILTHRQAEIWGDKGQRDKEGKVVKEPTGRMKLQGYNDIGYQVSGVIQMKADDKKRAPEKFSVDVIRCQMDVSLEGEKNWLTGEEISWTAIKGGMWK